MPTSTRWTAPAASPVAGPLPSQRELITSDRGVLPGRPEVSYDLVLVGGVPGAGKTTAIARATDDLAHVGAIDPEHVSWWLRQRLPAAGPVPGVPLGRASAATRSGSSTHLLERPGRGPPAGRPRSRHPAPVAAGCSSGWPTWPGGARCCSTSTSIGPPPGAGSSAAAGSSAPSTSTGRAGNGSAPALLGSPDWRATRRERRSGRPHRPRGRRGRAAPPLPRGLTGAASRPQPGWPRAHSFRRRAGPMLGSQNTNSATDGDGGQRHHLRQHAGPVPRPGPRSGRAAARTPG